VRETIAILKQLVLHNSLSFGKWLSWATEKDENDRINLNAKYRPDVSDIFGDGWYQ